MGRLLQFPSDCHRDAYVSLDGNIPADRRSRSPPKITHESHPRRGARRPGRRSPFRVSSIRKRSSSRRPRTRCLARRHRRAQACTSGYPRGVKFRRSAMRRRSHLRRLRQRPQRGRACCVAGCCSDRPYGASTLQGPWVPKNPDTCVARPIKYIGWVHVNRSRGSQVPPRYRIGRRQLQAQFACDAFPGARRDAVAHCQPARPRGARGGATELQPLGAEPISGVCPTYRKRLGGGSRMPWLTVAST